MSVHNFEVDPSGKLVDYYAELGVARTATQQEIQSAYRKLALKCHPDKNPDIPDAAERFKKLSAYRNVLGNNAKRQRYDKAATYQNAQSRKEPSGPRHRGDVHHEPKQRSPDVRGRSHSDHRPSGESVKDHEQDHDDGKFNDHSRRFDLRHRSPSSGDNEFRPPRSNSYHRSFRDRGPLSRSTNEYTEHVIRSRQSHRLRQPVLHETEDTTFNGYRLPVPGRGQGPHWNMTHKSYQAQSVFHRIIERCTYICEAARGVHSMLVWFEETAEEKLQLAMQDRGNIQDLRRGAMLAIMNDLLFQVLHASGKTYKAILRSLAEVPTMERDCMPLLTGVNDQVKAFRTSWLETENSLAAIDRILVAEGLRISSLTRSIENIVVMWGRAHDLPPRLVELIHSVRRAKTVRYEMWRNNKVYEIDMGN